ncbi:MAG TPA: FtsX-like permease family protein [Acidimicrobiales bacterium]|jgi:ABC-type lipoprotein release transport system permease subunit|nr:FtsX-like permease family protein [Acidimicrobiales bacterium]
MPADTITSAGPDRHDGAWAALRLWARRTTAERWRALVVLGLLTGMAAGLALAAVAGARRTSSAYGRWRTATSAADAIVFGTQLAYTNLDYSPVLALPEVVDGGTFTLAPISVPAWPRVGALAPGDSHLYETISRPLLIAGRLPDPRRTDEITVNRAAAAQLHVHVGQKVKISSATDQNAFYGAAPFDGPSLEATVVGIGDSQIDQIFMSNQAAFEPSAGFLAAYGDKVPHPPNLMVRLRPGTDVAAFRRDASRVLGLPDIPVRDLSSDRKRIIHATDLERTALLLFGAAVALAGIVIVGQTLTRTVYGMAADSPALRAIGFTRRDLVAGLVLPQIITAVVGGLTAIAVAISLSGRFPVGLAGQLDPDKGLHADWLVLVIGTVPLLVAVMGGAAWAGRRATVPSRRPPASASRRGVAGTIGAAAPLPVGIGAGLALSRGRGQRALPVGPALIGSIAGVLGIVGAFGLVHGIDDARVTPARAGQVWDTALQVDDQHSAPALTDAVRHDARVTAASTVTRVNVDIKGAGIPLYGIEPGKGALDFVVVSGRAPKGPDEVDLGPATAHQFHVRVGDHFRVGDGEGHDVKIVGLVLLPETAHSSFDQGVWATAPAVPNLAGAAFAGAGQSVVVRFRAGLDVAKQADLIGQQLGVESDPRIIPQDVLYLSNVRTLPKVLALFLALLGIAALAHVLVTAVRRRRHDLAVLRALGFSPRQASSCIRWQATTVAVVAVALGVPLGILVGARAWLWVADSAPLVFVTPVATLVALAVVPATFVVANAIAVLPARRVARLRPSEVLRAD